MAITGVRAVLLQPRPSSLDSQTLKTGVTPSGLRGFDGGKKTTGRKRHILVDTAGLLLAVMVTAPSVQDRDGARLLLARMQGFCKKPRLIWMDGAYRGLLLDWVAKRLRCRLQPVLRPDDNKRFAILPRRWVVERTFAWLGMHRRHARDYERLACNREAFIHIAMIHLMLRQLTPK